MNVQKKKWKIKAIMSDGIFVMSHLSGESCFPLPFWNYLACAKLEHVLSQKSVFPSMYVGNILKIIFVKVMDLLGELKYFEVIR